MKKINGILSDLVVDNEHHAFSPSQSADRGHVSFLDKWFLQRSLALLGNPAISVVLWNNEEITSSQAQPVARLLVRDRKSLYKLLRNPAVHFGDLYSTWHVEVEGDLVEFLEAINRGIRDSAEIRWLKKHLSWSWSRPRLNTLNDSKHNIHHHYDISNEFYEMWLDEEMQYTCAYFPDPTMTLEAAQLEKMDHVCRKLQLKPGDTVVEAGCGWGGLARHMAKHYGAFVRSYNISHEQIAYARERARTEGLSDRVEYIEDDYRNISGTYDAFVSVGMLEHVGKKHYKELGEVIHRSLTDHGRGLIHSIGRNRAAGRLNPWIEKRIFLGAHPPSLREMLDIFEPRNFSVLDVENLRMHYAKTLEHWLERYDAHIDEVGKMFDPAFVRVWRLYLSGSIAAFTTTLLQLYQVTFARGADNTIPWNREHLYSHLD